VKLELSECFSVFKEVQKIFVIHMTVAAENASMMLVLLLLDDVDVCGLFCAMC